MMYVEHDLREMADAYNEHTNISLDADGKTHNNYRA